MTQYIWDQKTPRIRYTKLIQDYKFGGLKLWDIQYKDIALKAALIVKWTKTHRNLNWLYAMLPIKDERISECNLNNSDFDRFFGNSKINISLQIWQACNKVNFISTPQDAQEILEQPLWGNSLITRAGMPFFQHEIINSNIFIVSDIVNMESGSFLKFNELEDKYGPSISIMMYNSLISAISRLWKHILRNEPHLGNIITVSKIE